jgi:osmotically inducible protein OsmC
MAQGEKHETESGALSHAGYGFATRFGKEAGTNPEELIAAAHASCFAMALSNRLGEAKMTPETISVTATVIMEKLDAGWTVIESHLDVTVKLAGADEGRFMTAAGEAKAGCPISRLLVGSARISMDARLA